jgi:hypothetical protein
MLIFCELASNRYPHEPFFDDTIFRRHRVRDPVRTTAGIGSTGSLAWNGCRSREASPGPTRRFLSQRHEL